MTTTYSSKTRKAIAKYGEEKCLQAYVMNVKQGEGGSYIALNLDLHINSTSAAIAAGEEIYKSPAQVEVRQTEALDKISREGKDCTILHSINYGDIEAWNLVTCYIQNAEQDGNTVLGTVQCSLPYESSDVQAYFRALGINF